MKEHDSSKSEQLSFGLDLDTADKKPEVDVAGPSQTATPRAGYRRVQNSSFRRLCDRIWARECVPFIGSGISNQCDLSDTDKSFAGRLGHEVDGMRQALLGEVKVRDDKRTLGELCESFLWARKGDNLPTSLYELVKALQVQEFSKLLPTKAHYCLALLVREGLISKIITTNYDSALEKAFLECLGSNASSSDHISVVHDQVSCVNQRTGLQGSGDCLHLYKINGCADELAKDPENYSKNILLTMTQLQSWRERGWAKDTFRMALRSNSVLFCGFGSDEPQVIHTIHQVLEEYSSFGGKSGVPKEPLPPNTPFIHSFLSSPEFSALQIANNFILRTFGTYDPSFSDQLILTRRKLEPDSVVDKLDADSFLLWIYQEIQLLQVRDIFQSVIDGKLAISGLKRSSHIFDSIAKEWKEDNSNQVAWWLDSAYESEAISYSSCRPTRLARIFSSLIEHDVRYAQIWKNQNPLAELLFIWWGLEPVGQTCRLVSSTDLGEWLEASSGNLADNQNFLVTGKRLSIGEFGNSNDIAASPSRVGFLLSGSHKFGAKKERLVRATFENRATNTRAYQTVAMFDFEDIARLLNEDSTKVSETDVKQLMANIVSSPRKWQSRLTTESKKDRYHGSVSL